MTAISSSRAPAVSCPDSFAAVHVDGRVGDTMPVFMEWTRLAISIRMPLMGRDTVEKPVMRPLWQRYCNARAAFDIDPWPFQRERCMALLDYFLRTQPLLPHERSRFLRFVNGHMARIGYRPS